MEKDQDSSLIQGEPSVGMVQGYDSTRPISSYNETSSKAPEIHVQDLMSYVENSHTLYHTHAHTH